MLPAMAHEPEIKLTPEEFESALVNAIRKAFSAEDTDEQQRFINVSQIPLIRQAIVTIEKRLASIEDNQKWVARLVLGAVILALLEVILVKTGGVS